MFAGTTRGTLRPRLQTTISLVFQTHLFEQMHFSKPIRKMHFPKLVWQVHCVYRNNDSDDDDDDDDDDDVDDVNDDHADCDDDNDLFSQFN